MEVVVRERGRVTLPREVREGDRPELSVEGGALVLRPKGAVRVADLKGLIGPLRVRLEGVEEAPGRV